MKKVLKKISLGNVSDTLSDNQLKRIIGGYSCTVGIRCWDGITYGGLCPAYSCEQCEQLQAPSGCTIVDCIC